MSQPTAKAASASCPEDADVDEYDDEGFEDAKSSPSHASQLPRPGAMKSDGTASTATRGDSVADGAIGPPCDEEDYEETFEVDDDADRASSPPTKDLTDAIVVDGRGYDYAEDNDCDDESDASREVSMDDNRSVKTMSD